MTKTWLMRCGASAMAALVASSMATGGASVPAHRGTGAVAVATFDTGRFLSTRGEVYAGLFGDSVLLESLTIGEATYRARLDELIEVASVRVYVAPALDGPSEFRLLSDEQIASGEHGIGFGIGRELDANHFSTALDVMQGLDLARMLHTDGTQHVRVDAVLTTPLRDSHPGEEDLNPELLVLGSFVNQAVRVGAIVGGNVDQPILSGKVAFVDPANYEEGRTGVSILIGGQQEPQAIAIIGLDLHVLGVDDDTAVLGFRIEVDPGEPMMFNLYGVGKAWQHGLATPIALLDDPEDFVEFELSATGWEPGGGGGGGLAMSQPTLGRGFPGRGGFRGGGSGGGGGGGFAPFPPPLFDPPPPGNGNGDNGDNGNGGDDRDDRGKSGPDIPTPGTLALLLAAALTFGRRRRG